MKFPTRAFVALAAAGLVLASSVAQVSATPRPSACVKTFTRPMFDRATRAVYRGTRLPQRGAYGHLWRFARCQRPPSSEVLARHDWARYLAAWAGRRHPVAPQASVAAVSSSDYGDVPGVPYWFASCVALRESTDGAGSPDIYGILPSNGYFSGMGIVAQKMLFAAMYARDGVSPWAPYDGC